jgi:hypothetical protein
MQVHACACQIMHQEHSHAPSHCPTTTTTPITCTGQGQQPSSVAQQQAMMGWHVLGLVYSSNQHSTHPASLLAALAEHGQVVSQVVDA